LICAFIAEHRARFGVASICRVLSEHGCRIAPRTFYAWVKRPLSARALWDIVITEILAGYYEPDDQGRKKPESLYGSVKMWAHLNREGIAVAKCTVERLMRAHGWQGVRRLKRIRTTVCDPAADRAPDLVKRGFRAPVPGRLLVADFTYVRLAGGTFAYTAFVIDAFANRILGWECSASKQTRFVEAAIRQAAVTLGETLLLHGMVPSIGTVGDAFDNALAETTIELYKHECIRADSPFRRGPLERLSDLEMITADWVHWYNTSRLMHHLGRIPPVEAETNYYADINAGRPARHT
jgi:putative transposase